MRCMNASASRLELGLGPALCMSPALRLGLCALALAAASAPAPAQSLLDVMRRALAEQPSRAAAAAATEAAQEEVTRSESDLWPSLGAEATAARGEQKYRTNNATPVLAYSLNLGGREFANLGRAGQLVAAAQASQRSNADQVALQAADAYLRWARSLALVQVARQGLQAHERILGDVEKIAAADVGRKIDLVQVQVRADTARLTLSQREIELRAAAERLQRYWPEPLPAAPTGLDEIPSAMPPSSEGAAAAVTEEHPALSEAQARLAAAQSAIDAADAERWPTLTASVSQAPPTTTGLRDKVWLGRITLSMPLLDGGALDSRSRSAQASYRYAAANRDDLQATLRERAQGAWHDWEAAQQRLLQAQKLSEQGAWLTNGYEAQFRLGRRSLLDLLNVHNDRLGYEGTQINAYFDERLARFRVTASLGGLASWLVQQPSDGRSWGRQPDRNPVSPPKLEPESGAFPY
jgi:adhesin transport system outer membrane protein